MNGASHGAPLAFLMESLAEGGEVARRVFEAMMEMGKIDVARIEAAARGEA